MVAVFGIPRARFLIKKLNKAARFVTRNYCFKTGSMIGILETMKMEDSQGK